MKALLKNEIIELNNYKNMSDEEIKEQLEWSDHHEFSYGYSIWAFERIKQLKKPSIIVDIKDDENIKELIDQLQSNWNSLRECIEENKKVAMEYTKRVESSGLCQGDYPVPYYHAIKRIDLDNLYLDKMNELEGEEWKY